MGLADTNISRRQALGLIATGAAAAGTGLVGGEALGIFLAGKWPDKEGSTTVETSTDDQEKFFSDKEVTALDEIYGELKEHPFWGPILGAELPFLYNYRVALFPKLMEQIARLWRTDKDKALETLQGMDMLSSKVNTDLVQSDAEIWEGQVEITDPASPYISEQESTNSVEYVRKTIIERILEKFPGLAVLVPKEIKVGYLTRYDDQRTGEPVSTYRKYPQVSKGGIILPALSLLSPKSDVLQAKSLHVMSSCLKTELDLGKVLQFMRQGKLPQLSEVMNALLAARNATAKRPEVKKLLDTADSTEVRNHRAHYIFSRAPGLGSIGSEFDLMPDNYCSTEGDTPEARKTAWEEANERMRAAHRAIEALLSKDGTSNDVWLAWAAAEREELDRTSTPK